MPAFTRPERLTVELPEWLSGRALDLERTFPTDDERMELAIALSRTNVERGTGGPFGAAVFDTRSGYVVAAGVNRVVPERCALAHAEAMAIALAQAALDAPDFRGVEYPLQLATSAEPCAMCLAVVRNVGLQSILIGARDEDVRAIGFDEGYKPEDWPERLRREGVELVRDVRRDDAAAVLRAYVEGGGPIYHP